MSDDRELVERLAAIDAAPRAGWVADLRAELDAAWEAEDPAYLDSLRTTTVSLVEDQPTLSKPSSRRRAILIIAAAAAVVFVVGVVVVTFDRDDTTPANQPSPTVTVPPTAPPPARPLPDVPGDRLVPGTYFVDEVSETPTPRIYATLGAGWWDSGAVGWALAKRDSWVGEVGSDEYPQHDIGSMSFSIPVAVYADACHWQDGNHPGPVETLDGLVAALTEQRGWADVTVPSEIIIDGYVGKAFQRTAPADMSDCSTRSTRTRVMPSSAAPVTSSDFRSWDTANGRGEGGFYYEPGEIETLWVVDLEGTVVVINTGVWPEPSAGAAPDFAADVLDSIRIDPRPLPNAPGQPLEAGTYFVDDVNGTPTPRIFATLDAGWFDLDVQPGWHHIAKGRVPWGIGYVAISNPVAVFSDACHPADGFYPGSVATVDGFVTALREQQGGWVEVTAPSDISVDGYGGKAFQRTPPADMSDCTSWDGSPRSSGMAAFPSWESADGINDGYAPGEIETLWVLDIDGTVIVINTKLLPDPPAGANADFADAVLESLRIDRA